jgi:ribose transport system ATP-binding protein
MIEELVRYMVGRELTDIFPKTIRKPKDVILSVRKVDSSDIKNISFDLCSGEVLGVFGLLGSGKEKLARVVYGIDPVINGEIYINGKKLRSSAPYIAMFSGIGLITENRREEGIIPLLSVKRNMTMPSLNTLSNGGWLFNPRERRVAKTYVKRLDIKAPSLSKEVMYLSGGNQQKVILARWMIHKQKVLIVSEPTRGIDVGSKVEIHKIIDEMANQGMAIIMISSEIEEIIGLSDRIIVMYEGVITKEFSREEATNKKLMTAAVGGVN